MVTTVLLVLTGLMGLLILFWAAVFLVELYRVRRSIRSGRLLFIKTLYGHHFRRKAFLMGSKR